MDSAVFTMSTQGDASDRDSAMAHEVGGHGAAVVNGSYNSWSDKSVPGSSPDRYTGEQNDLEEARAYIRQDRILTEINGAAGASDAMAGDLPHWSLDDSQWSMYHIQNACSRVAGCMP